MAATIQTIEKPTRARALDTSGNNNHGQIYSGRALEFDGSTDYLTYTSTEELEEFTAVGWINCYGDTGVIQNIWDGNAGGTYPAIYNGTPKISWYAPVVNWMQTGKVIEYNTWYRVVFVFKRNGSAADYRVYINGIEDTGGDFPATGVGTYTNGKFDGIGSIGQGTTRFFNGMMSDMQVWNTSWTAEDALYDYNNPEQLALNRGGTSLTNSNLKIWYPMNDGHRGQQSYVLDASNLGIGNELIDSQSDRDFSGSNNWALVNGSGSATMSTTGGQLVFSGSTTSDYPYLHRDYVTDFKAGDSIRYELVLSDVSGGTVKVQLDGGANIATGLTSGTNIFYHNGTSGNALKGETRIIPESSSMSFKIDSLSLKPVNNKNHATTVFKGDELITVSKDKNMDASNNWDVSSANWSIDGNSLDYDGSGGGNAALDQTYPAFVAGRTYEMKFNTSANDTIITIKDGDGSNTFVAEDTYSSGTKTVTFVAPATTDGLMFTAGGSSGAFAIDWINIKEVGIASGWTDADQQLDIPQTALQSYNQLAWFDGHYGNRATLDSTISTTTNSWSLSFWLFNIDNGDYYDFIIGSTSNRNLAVDNNTDRKLYYRASNGSYYALSDAVIPQGEWVHIIVTATADTSMTAYVNGEVQTTNSSMSDTELILDRFMAGYNTSSYESIGSINEISYYDDVLTATEAKDLYNDGKAKSALEASGSGNLVGYWRNNGLAEWKDLKGSNDVNTTGNEETLLITAGADATRDSQGFLMNRQKLTNSFNNDYQENTATIGGIGHYVDVPGFNFHATVFSISCWIKSYTMSANETILDKYYNTQNQRAVRLYITTSGELQLQVSDDGSSNESQKTTDANLVADTWYHIVVTYSSGTFTAYRNGTALSVDANFGTETSIDQNVAPLRIGMSQDTKGSFNGQIDDLAIYDNKVLSATEVTRNYNAGKRSHR